MMEIREEEGERDSERRDGPGDEIGSDSVLEFIRNFPMYSPPRSLTDWRADQVHSPPLDLFGLQFGYEAYFSYLPPATTTVCNVEASLGFPGLDLKFLCPLEKDSYVRFLKERNRVLREENSLLVKEFFLKEKSRFLGVENSLLLKKIILEIEGAKNRRKVGSAEKSCIAISHSKEKNKIETPKRKYRTERSITLDDLRPLFGKKRVDAGKTLGVSVSTFKRYCRQNGITRWNGDGCSLVEPMLVTNFVQQNSSGSKPPEVQGEKEISVLLDARQDAVTIKAKYGEGNLKFELSSESSFAELQEAVAKRLKSKAFIVEYKDEDQEPILIACDEDWQACVKFFGNQVIRLAIRREDFQF